jgi:hypothetical protein
MSESGVNEADQGAGEFCQCPCPAPCIVDGPRNLDAVFKSTPSSLALAGQRMPFSEPCKHPNLA